MRKSTRMNPVLQVADRRERDAARELGECQRRLAEQQQQLRQLEDYRAEYYRTLQERGSTGTSAARWVEMQRFLAQLNEAIGQQQQLIAQTNRLCMQKRQFWFKARSKSQAVEKVKFRLEEEERMAAERSEQKELDELAQRRKRDGTE